MKKKKTSKKKNKFVFLLVAVIILTSALIGIKTINNNPRNPISEKAPSESKNADVSMDLSETAGTASSEVKTSESIVSPTEEQTVSIDNKVNSTSKTETTEKPTAAPTEKSEKSESGRTIVNPESGDWNLIVVNGKREIKKGYEPKLKEILGCGKYLDYRVAPHYEEMYYAAKKDGITLTPYSAYRSYERQENNYNNLTNQYMSQYKLSKKEAAKKAATVILPPGTSEHNLGLAMDICNTYDSFANSKEYKWLTENAHKYGFILRYTAEKQPITGIVPEPWHWRYVGVEYAEKIKNSGLCLEEYLDLA